MPKFSAHLGYLFTENALADRFERAVACGFAAIEYPSPDTCGIAAFAAAVRHHGLAVTQIAAPVGDFEPGAKGLTCLPDQRDAFRHSIVSGTAAAHEIGSPFLHVMAGVMPENVTRDECRDLYLENLSWAADHCAGTGVDILVEAISDETVPGFFLNHPDLAVDLIMEIDRGNIRLLFDVYHAAVKSVDAIRFISHHLPLIGHIQIADHPGRGEPGSGCLPFADIFRCLDESGYDGWVGCEYKPTGKTDACLDWREAVPGQGT